MVVKRPRLIPVDLRDSESFRADFKRLLVLSEDQINKLAEIGDSEDGFNLPEESIASAAATLEIEDKEITGILAVARYLYNRASIERIYEKGAEEVCDFAASIGLKDCDAKVSAIRHLLTRKEAYEYSILEAYSASIVVPTISDVNVVCDIRAVVAPRNDEVVGYVPVALMGMEIEYSESEKKTFTLQLDEATLDILLDDLNRAKRLLESLKEKFGGKKS